MSTAASFLATANSNIKAAGRTTLIEEKKLAITFVSKLLRGPEKRVEDAHNEAKLIVNFAFSFLRRPPPMHMEARAFKEVAGFALYLSRHSHESLDGEGRPVLLIPGFLAGDYTMALPARWFKDNSFIPYHAGMSANIMYTDNILKTLSAQIADIAEKHGKEVIIFGHSRGGMLGKLLSDSYPELTHSLIAIGSPLGQPFGVNPLIAAAVPPVHIINLLANGKGAELELDYLMQLEKPVKVLTTSFFSKTDGIVAYRSCIRDDVNTIELKSSHTGMAHSIELYRQLKSVLRHGPELKLAS